MSALFSSGWSGMALLDDLERGVLDRFLVSPVSRVSLIAGRLMQGALIVVVQSLILVAPRPGRRRRDGRRPGRRRRADRRLDPARLGLRLAVQRPGAGRPSGGDADRRREPRHPAADLPLDGVHAALPHSGWIQDVSAVNPVDWAVTAGRQALSPDPDWGMIAPPSGLLLAFALLCTWFAARAFRAYQRSV